MRLEDAFCDLKTTMVLKDLTSDYHSEKKILKISITFIKIKTHTGIFLTALSLVCMYIVSF